MARARPGAIPHSLAFSAIALLSALSVLAGCAGAPATPPISQSPTSVAATSTAPTTPALPTAGTSTPAASGSSSPSPAAGVQPLAFGKLATGRYRPVHFGIPITFAVVGGPDGWAAVLDERGFVQLSAQRNASDQLTFALPTSLAEAGKGLFDSLLGQVDDIGSIRSTTVDGYPGREADFQVPPVRDLGGLIVFSADGWTYFAAVGNHLLVLQVDHGDAIFLVIIETLEVHWPSIAPVAQAVIESIDFE